MYTESSATSDGAPLAVCVSDCELDHGQDPRELVVLCFKVHCAFARMRWTEFLDKDPELKSEVEGLSGDRACLTGAARS
jgi:hypothetical protein